VLRCWNFDQLQSRFDPSDTAVEIVEPHRQIGKVDLNFRYTQVERGDLPLQRPKTMDDLVQFFALRCLLRADRPKHV
jgi:hypothetical protein